MAGGALFDTLPVSVNKVYFDKEKLKILVTGATGLLGVNLVKRLVNDNHSVRILTRLKSPVWPFDGLEVERFIGDIVDGRSVRLAAEGCDVVFHAAGFVSFTPFLRHRAYSINVTGTRHVIEACQGARVRRLVHVSSIAAIGYGQNREVVDETVPWNFDTLKDPYHDTKREAELSVISAAQNSDLDAVVVNPGYLLGPWDIKPSSGRLILVAASGWLWIYPTGGISVVHVGDVVEGMIQALRRGRAGERYALSGENITYKELFTKIARMAKVRSPFLPFSKVATLPLGLLGDQLGKMWPKAFSDINTPVLSSGHIHHYISSQKAQDELGYTFRPVSSAISEAYQWFLQHGYIKKHKGCGGK